MEREFLQHGWITTHFDVTRKELEAWTRRRAVILQFACIVFKHSIRTYKRVFAVNMKTLKKLRRDHKTGKNETGSMWLYQTITRDQMYELLGFPIDKFRIHVSAGTKRATAHAVFTIDGDRRVYELYERR